MRYRQPVLNLYQSSQIWLTSFVYSLFELLFLAITATLSYHKSETEILEEYDIIKNAQKNPENFAPLYLKYYDRLFLFIQKRVDNLDASAEVTSRVFLKSLKNIGRYKYQGVPFSAWLYRIAINEINLFFREQHKMERVVNITDDHVNIIISEIEYSAPVLDPCILVPVLLEQLNEDEIQLIELRFFEELSFKEIGYLLGLTEVNAKIKTYRVIDKLKKISKEIKYHD
ncbi:MAG: sigma-70 family RNA polymerase sigma factor [Bacteroidota bacterium]